MQRQETEQKQGAKREPELEQKRNQEQKRSERLEKELRRSEQQESSLRRSGREYNEPQDADQQKGTEQRIVQDISIGRNLRRMRLREDLTQDQVASKLQLMGLPVSRGIYAQIEVGTHHIPITWLMGLKRIFHTTYVDMLETEETTAFLRELE